MPVEALIRVKTLEDYKQHFLKELSAHPEVGLAMEVLGEFPLVLLVRVSSAEELGKFVVDKIHRGRKVIQSETMIVIGAIDFVNWLAESASHPQNSEIDTD